MKKLISRKSSKKLANQGSTKKPKGTFPLNLTGKMSILLELEEYDPMIIDVNDIDEVVKIINLLLKSTPLDVKTYTASVGKRAASILSKKI